jgi:polysaccharide export outer membrane protein
MRSSRFALTAALGLLLIAVAPAAGDEPPKAGAASAQDGSGPEALDHAVGPEDLLEISVFEIPELNRTVRVSERGTISMPLLGEMAVAGLTATRLEERLREELTKRYLKDPQVSVFVREHGSRKVSVLGAVGKPGVYEMLGPRTLLQVLSQAGGLTKEAGAELYVIRSISGDGADRITVGIPDLLMNRDPALNLAVQPGDVVSVPIDQPIYVYVDGAVKTPGRIDQMGSRPLTLLQAVAKVGGATERANLKRVQILRRGPTGGQQVALTVNLNKIRGGQQADPVLTDGDVVVVPETFF